jgi:DNA-binding XRE family transcriptional regulator
VDTATVTNWEVGNTPVQDRFIPTVISFLGGHNPMPDPATRGQAVRGERITRGWSQARLADKAQVDPATVARLEADTKGMARRAVAAILAVLELPPDW